MELANKRAPLLERKQKRLAGSAPAAATAEGAPADDPPAATADKARKADIAAAEGAGTPAVGSKQPRRAQAAAVAPAPEPAAKRARTEPVTDKAMVDAKQPTASAGMDAVGKPDAVGAAAGGKAAGGLFTPTRRRLLVRDVHRQ